MLQNDIFGVLKIVFHAKWRNADTTFYSAAWRWHESRAFSHKEQISPLVTTILTL